jgi:hypothetical protein
MADILRGLVEIDDRVGRGFYNVQVKLHTGELGCHIIVDPQCSYVVR